MSSIQINLRNISFAAIFTVDHSSEVGSARFGVPRIVAS